MLFSQVNEFLAAGADAVFSKPFKPDQIAALLSHIRSHGNKSVPDVKFTFSRGRMVRFEPRSND